LLAIYDVSLGQVYARFLYFGGKLFRVNYPQSGQPDLVKMIYRDHLGTVVRTTGDNPADTSMGEMGFATYLRDGNTNYDYAWHRYYASGQGRFTSPDPYHASGKLGNPQSLNRYSYSTNDPINSNDPTGLENGIPNGLEIPPFVTGKIVVNVFGDMPATAPMGRSLPEDPSFHSPVVGGDGLYAADAGFSRDGEGGFGGDGGGSGPDPVASELLAKLPKHARFLATSFKPSSGCNKLFTDLGTSFSAVATALSKTQFLNGTTGYLAENTRDGNTSVADVFRIKDGTKAMTVPGVGVFIGMFDFWNAQTERVVNSLLMHEGLHLVFGYNKKDTDIQAKWGLDVDASRSGNINGKIVDDCFPRSNSSNNTQTRMR
jgi:RHS repeat-associated protein